MSRVNMRFLVVVALLLVGVLATASAQASTIFFDGFDGSQVVSNPAPYTGTMPVSVPATWNATVYGTDVITIGGGVATFNSGAIETGTLAGISTQLSGLGSTTDWTAEVRFKATGTLATNGSNRDYNLLTGDTDAAVLNTTGIDFRLMQDGSGAGGGTYSLGWYGYDGIVGTRVPSLLATGLAKDQFYIAAAHRKSDGNVDIYLNGSLIATKTAINLPVNPLLFRIGDGSSSVAGTVSLDYVSVTAVPEPGSMVLLSIGLVGLLAYAWRKRR
jgi:hypothetical protein